MVATASQDTQFDGQDAFPRWGLAGLRHASFLQILPLLILAYSVLLPQEVRVSLAEQNIYPYRAAIILLSPWFIYQIASGSLRCHFVDGMVFLGCGWIVIAMMAIYSPGQGLIRGMAIGLDIVAPYLAGRICVREISDFRRFLVFFAPGAAFVAAGMLAESAAGAPLVRPAFAQIFGPLPQYLGGEEFSALHVGPTFRFGLLRASGPFAHPILAGLFLASLLPLYALSGIKGWPRKLGVGSSLFAVLTWSSAAIFGLLIPIAMVLFDWLQKAIEFISWKMAFYFGLLGALIIQLGSQNGLISILVRMTIDPQTGYDRLLIWRFGLESSRNHPIFGIGYASYERYEWMSESIDAHWLLLGVRHGLLTMIALLAAAVATIALVGFAASRHHETDRAALVGVGIALLTMTLLGFTVAFFGGVMIWYFVLVGISLSLSQIESALD